MEELFLGFFLLCLTFTVTAVSLGSEVLNQTVGEDCVLEVSVPEGRVIVLEWTKDKADVFFYNDGITETPDDQYRGRVQVQTETLTQNQGTLKVTLKKLRLDDSGIFVCKTFIQTSQGNKHFTKTVELRVSKSPEVPTGRLKARKDNKNKVDDSKDPQKSSLPETENDIAVVPIVVGVILAVFVLVAGFIVVLKKKETINTCLNKEKSSEPSIKALNPPVSGEPLVPLV